MPIYEYQCLKCDHQLEALQKLSDPALSECPECGESSLKKAVSAPNFRLKGSGWYETDFKKDGDKKRNLADSPKTETSADKPSAGKAGTDSAKGNSSGKPVEKSSVKTKSSSGE